MSNVYIQQPSELTALTSSVAQNQPPPLEMLSFLPPPPPWLIWLTALVAFGTLIWRMYTFYVDRSDLKTERDEYWYRNVVIPICIEPLVKFIEELTANLRKLETETKEVKQPKRSTTYKIFLKTFKAQKDSVINRFLVLISAEAVIYQRISNALDEIEDIVTQHCAINSLGEDLVDDTKYGGASVVEQEIFVQLRKISDNLRVLHREVFDTITN